MKYLFLALLTTATFASEIDITRTDIRNGNEGINSRGVSHNATSKGVRYNFKVVQDVSSSFALILGASFTDVDTNRVNSNDRTVNSDRDGRTTTVGLRFKY